MDGYFDDTMNFLLPIGFVAAGSPPYGSNDILYPDPPGHPGPDPVDGIRTIDRESWHDSPNDAFYTNFGSLFAEVASTYSSRFKGVRWNHEIQPWRFKLGSAWESYINAREPIAWAALQNGDAAAWSAWLNALANPEEGNSGRKHRL